LLDATLSAVRRLARALAPDGAKASRAHALVHLDGPGQPVWSPRDYAALAREGYMQNPIVFRAVRMVAEAAASVPLVLWREGREIEAHPLIDLLARPGAGRCQADLLETLYAHLAIAGNAYVEAVAVEGSVRELHALRPDRMKVIAGADGWPAGHEYQAGGRAVRFTGEIAPGVPPVLHIKAFHPANDHYGFAAIEAAAAAIDIHNAASAWHKALLDNAARPSGALVYSGSGALSGEQFERLKSELEAGFQGPRNAGRPLLLEGGLEWRPLSYSPRDMDFLEAKHASAREIALALGVPPMLLAIPGDNTYSNYQEASRVFWRQTVLPLVARTAEQLAGWFAPAWGEELRLLPDADDIPALAFEREALWARLDRASFLTNDEKRAAAGYGEEEAPDPAPGGRLPAGESPGASKRHSQKFNPYHDALGRFTTAEGAAQGGGDGSGEDDDYQNEGIARVADDGRSGYPIDVLEEDALGGHTFERHVAKSNEYLKARILANRTNIPLIGSVGEKRAGSFSSLEAANKLINSTISANREQIARFLSGGLLFSFPSMYLFRDFEQPTGYEAYAPNDRAQPVIRPTFGVSVHIGRTDRAPRGYRVVRAWPMNRD
jgi:HK97 family phage portal protein